MPPRQIIIILIAVLLSAGLTVWALAASGINPVYVLLIAMLASVLLRLWARRK